MTTNITIALNSELAKALRVYAAERGMSLSRLMSEQVTELLKRDQGYKNARQRALLELREPRPLGWAKPASRDDLYER